jgi:hypothetical protein
MSTIDESIVGISTKAPAGSAGTYDESELGNTISRLRRFKSLSDDDKSSLTETIFSLVKKGFSLGSIHKLLSALNEDEGLVAKRAIMRFYNAITPVQLKDEGVIRPLDSGYTSGGKKLTIYLPDKLEPYADHGIILELLRYKSCVDNVDIQRCPGILSIQAEDRLSSLFMGYISELLSNQTIAKVSYTKTSYYQLGRALARAKLLQFVATDCNIPLKYFQIPGRFLGGTTEFQDPESIRTLKTLLSGDVERIDDLLKNLAAHVWKTQCEQVKSKIDESLLMAFPEFVHMHERRARVQSKKGRGGRVITTFSTIKPTKPSTLSTVAPWEKESVQELWDSPWDELQSLEKEYINTPPLDRKYAELSNKLTSIINDMWQHKQIMLRKTQHRLVLSKLSDQTPLWQRLNATRANLSESKSIDTCDVEILFRTISVYDILPSGFTTLEDGLKTSWVTALKEGHLTARYPQTSRLIRRYDDIISPPSEPLLAP